MTCPICNAKNVAPAFNRNGYSIYKCMSCMGFFVSPLPNTEAISEFYKQYYKTDKYTSKLDSKIRRARRRIQSLKRCRGETFIDIGCNAGFAVEAANQLGFKATGIDIDHDAIEFGRINFPSIELHQTDMIDIIRSGRKFDIVYSSEVIEHISDPDLFMTQIKSVMNLNSVLYLTTPDVGHFSLLWRSPRLELWDNFRPPEHLLYFTRAGLKALLNRHGFMTIKFVFGTNPTIRVIASQS